MPIKVVGQEAEALQIGECILSDAEANHAAEKWVNMLCILLLLHCRTNSLNFNLIALASADA